MRTVESPITIAEGRVVVTPAPDGSVWMSKHEIARLFGCFVAKVVSNIPVILKSGVLDENRVCHFHRYKDGGGVELYNLEMIVALSFRIGTHNAEIFRRWLMERATTQPASKLRPPISVFVPMKENDRRPCFRLLPSETLRGLHGVTERAATLSGIIEGIGQSRLPVKEKLRVEFAGCRHTRITLLTQTTQPIVSTPLTQVTRPTVLTVGRVTQRKG